MKKQLLFTLFLNANALYDETLAKKYMNLSGLAYCVEQHAPQLEHWMCKTCLEQHYLLNKIVTVHNNETNANGFVSIIDGNELVISYSGTNSASMTNWIEDINMIKEQAFDVCDGCFVHRGFYHTYKSIREDILTAFQTMYTPKIQTLSITGHSLGAGLATLTVSDILRNYDLSSIATKHIYVYGSPRVGGYNYMSDYDSLLSEEGLEHFRIVHAKDPVPHLPPSTMDFYGVGVEIFYEESFDDDYQVCTNHKHMRNLYETADCSNQYYVNMNVYNHLDYFDYVFETEYNCV